MLPSYATNNARHAGSAYSIFTAEAGLCRAIGMAAANLAHLIIRQLGRWSVIPFGLSTFGNLIGGVVSLRTQEGVMWVATPPIRYVSWRVIHVALVEVMKPIGNWAVVQFPTKTMRANYFAIHRHHPIAGDARGSLPQPAFVNFAGCEVLPKALNKRCFGYVMSRAALIMSVNKSCLMAWKPCTRKWRSAVTCTQSTWVRRHNGVILSPTMSENKSERLPLDQAIAFTRPGSHIRFAAATTMAIAIWDFVRVWGMLGVHENLHFSCRAGAPQRRRLFLLGCYFYIIAQMGA